KIIDDHWRFKKDTVSGYEKSGFDDYPWRVLNLPHDWSIEDLPGQLQDSVSGPFSKASVGKGATAYSVGGTGWYRKNFRVSKSEANKTVYLNFDGVYMNATVWLNGHILGNHPYGYTPFYYNIDTYDRQTNQYTLQWLNPQPTGSNVATEYLTYNRNVGSDNINTFVYFQGVLDYNKRIGENHNISAALIGTRQQQIYSDAKDPKTNYTQTTLQYSLPYRNLTLAGRTTYSYKSRYYLEFNFGYNGSERFSDEHRYGFFPTIGASWIISGEKFWGDLYDVFDRMKLRASYGLVGNDAIGEQRFFYLSDVNLNGGNSAYFGTENGYGRNGVSIRSYENRDVTWETSKQLNLGLEFSLFKKLNVIAEVYQNKKYDILQNRSMDTSIPSSMGLEAAIASNIGKVTSRGVDISIDGRHNFNQRAWIAARGNFTFSENKFTQYEEPNYYEAYRYNVGQPLNRAYGYVAERLFVDDNEARNSPSQVFSTNGQAPMGGDIKYRDLNNDGKIDGADQTFLGNPNVPQMVYGFGITSGFKNFDFSVFFQGQARVSFFIDPARTSPFIQSPDSWLPGNTQLLKAYADDHWSESNQNLYALYPRLGANGAQIENNRQNSTWWMRDGSFLRLKSLEIGYTIPVKYAQAIKLRNARIYFNGLNLYTWSPFKLWDPELGGRGFNYPIQKVFNMGINVNL
ncbi:MAG: SusC/RagA family TonB-linked outer membrane protein, partial [Sphingobacteriales bacterium]